MRRNLLTLLVLVLALVSGCVRQTVQADTYQVYFMTQGTGEVPPSALVAEQRALPEGRDPVEGLLGCLLSGPVTEGLVRAIPTSVTLRDWSLENGLLTVDFSGRYGGLSGVDLTLADYSVVLTLTQLEGVEEVMITADGDLIAYRDHQRLTAGDVQSLTAGEGQESEG